MPARPTSHPLTTSGPRYGCHECREDLDMVLSGRAHHDVREQFRQHLERCRDCRRIHRTLHSLYERRPEPRARTESECDREFTAILGAVEAPAPSMANRLLAPAGGLALVVGAAALVLAVRGWTVGTDPVASDASAFSAHGLPGEASLAMGGGDGGIDHPAQSYGRVIGGRADLFVGPERGRNPAAKSFPVGTRFEIGLGESLQLALAGKVMANFTAGTDIVWTDATSRLISLEMHRGLVAFRYDRRESDPILEVHAPGAIVRVTGTVFTVQVDWTGDSVVSVLHGAVEVLHPENRQFLARVESGYRFDVARSTIADVGKTEVSAALPLSNGVPDGPDGRQMLADGRIPPTWVVPGLGSDPARRTLAFVPDPQFAPATSLAVSDSPARKRRFDETPHLEDDDGENLIEYLMRDAEATHRKEKQAIIERCRDLYSSDKTRYRSARCFEDFLRQHDSNPHAIEAHLLLGILRMDYALDYRAADAKFQDFLSRAPADHPMAELAAYRMWLAATEEGRISLAIERGRQYLGRYPEGKYVGKVLQRFPELKDQL